MLLAALLVLINVVNTGGEYLLGRTVVQASEAQFGTDPGSLEARQKFVGGFYGDFFGMVNLVSFLGQMFVVSRIMTRFGVGGALLVHPLVALTGYLTMMVSPGPGPRQELQSRRQRPRLLAQQHRQARAVAAHEPGGQVQGQAGRGCLLLAHRRRHCGRGRVGWAASLAFSVPVFATINAAFALVWFGVSWALGRENRRRVAAAGETP